MIVKKIVIFFSFYGISSMHALSCKPIATAAHWALAGGSTWIEAAKHGRFLSSAYTKQFLGQERASKQDEAMVYDFLNAHLLYHWNAIPIYNLKTELRMLMPYPCVCTDGAIYINPDILPYIDDEDKKRELLFIGKMIQKRFMATTTLALTALPLCTEAATRSYAALCKKIQTSLTNAPIAAGLVDAQNYFIQSAVAKFLINRYATNRYFTYQRNHLSILHGQN